MSGNLVRTGLHPNISSRIFFQLKIDVLPETWQYSTTKVSAVIRTAN